MKKFGKLFIAFALIVSIIAPAVFFGNTEAAQAKTKKVTNKTIVVEGYSITYPSTYTVKKVVEPVANNAPRNSVYIYLKKKKVARIFLQDASVVGNWTVLGPYLQTAMDAKMITENIKAIWNYLGYTITDVKVSNFDAKFCKGSLAANYKFTKGKTKCNGVVYTGMIDKYMVSADALEMSKGIIKDVEKIFNSVKKK